MLPSELICCVTEYLSYPTVMKLNAVCRDLYGVHDLAVSKIQEVAKGATETSWLKKLQYILQQLILENRALEIRRLLADCKDVGNWISRVSLNLLRPNSRRAAISYYSMISGKSSTPRDLAVLCATGIVKLGHLDIIHLAHACWHAGRNFNLPEEADDMLEDLIVLAIRMDNPVAYFRMIKRRQDKKDFLDLYDISNYRNAGALHYVTWRDIELIAYYGSYMIYFYPNYCLYSSDHHSLMTRDIGKEPNALLSFYLLMHLDTGTIMSTNLVHMKYHRCKVCN